MSNNQLAPMIFGTTVKTPYDTPPCYELDGKRFTLDIAGKGNRELCIRPNTLDFCGRTSGYTCVKCGDNVYFLQFGSDALLFHATSGSAIFAENSHELYKSAATPAYAGELCGGWLDACFLPGHTVHMEFSEGKVMVDGTEFSAGYARLSDVVYAVSIAAGDGGTVLVIDTARFLLYAAAETTGMFSGYARPV